MLYEESILHLATAGQFIVCNDKYGLPGTVLPAYCTAAGKLFLSQLDDETLETWVRSHNLVPYTANTIIDPDELLFKVEVDAQGLHLFRQVTRAEQGLCHIQIEEMHG